MPEVERLLVVDDEAPILHALQRTFEAAGYEVIACADPAEALDRLREEAVPGALGGLHDAGMTGAEFPRAGQGAAARDHPHPAHRGA